MAELADALDLGSSEVTRVGSTPSTRTTLRPTGFGWQASYITKRREKDAS